MASFVGQTRLVQHADEVGGVKTVLATPVVVATYPGAIETVAACPDGAAIPEADRWQYRVDWEVRAHVLPTVRGVIPYAAPPGLLVTDVDLWFTQADRLAGQQPVLRETVGMQFWSKVNRQVGEEVHATIDALLIRATFGNYGGDRRDTGLVAATSTRTQDDPLRLYSDNDVRRIDGQFVTLPPTWRAGRAG